MRGLKILVVVMGLMIVVGVVVLVATIVGRMAGPKPMQALMETSLLQEPPGTHIAQISAAGDRVVLLLQGGGPDRLVALDLRTGQILLHAGLTP